MLNYCSRNGLNNVTKNIIVLILYDYENTKYILAHTAVLKI
jgi:hypothetical protein